MAAGVFGEIAADGKRIVLVVAGDDFELDRAAAALRHMTPLCSPTKPKSGALTAPLTWVTVTQLGHTFDGGSLGQWFPGPKLNAWILDEFTRRTTVADPAQVASSFQPVANYDQVATDLQHDAADHPRVATGLQHNAAVPPELARSPQPLPVDKSVTATEELIASVLKPRPYQLAAAAMIGATGKFLLCDDPGLGKTVSAILGLKAREQAGHAIFPMVIVVPSWDVADVWARHIGTWAPAWTGAVMYGGKDRDALAARKGGGILVTTYATARLDAADASGPLVKLRAKSVVADEAHLVKNEGSLQSQAVRRIASRAGTVIALSGTPVTRDTGDVYPVLAAMDPASWPSRDRFVKRYCDKSDDEYGPGQIEGLKPLAEPEFRAAILGQLRRVAKTDVLSELPPKVYSVRRVELPPQWRRAYDGMAAEMLAELPDGTELNVMSVLAQLTRLSQLSASAADVEVTEEPDPRRPGGMRKHYEVTLRAPSWKADALLEVLAERPHQQVAVFANSRQLITLAGAACEAAGHRCGYITGGQGKTARRDDIAAFQAGELDVILATSGAGSLGITLTAAGTVVMLQRSWELDKAIQPEDRAHRIGNENQCVEIIDVIARGTVDDKVRELTRVKGSRLAELVQDARLVRELFGGLK